MADWIGLDEFISVAEHQSFTHAAKELGTSVAHVSRRVGALESRLGVRLLQRTTRKVSLTEAGQQFYQECKPLQERLTEAENRITQSQTEPRGTIRMTAPVTYGGQTLAPIINDFLLSHPAINIDMHLTNQTLDLVEQGIDIAIRLGQLTDSNLIAKRLGNRQLYTCASPEYLREHGQPTQLNELNEHSCLTGTAQGWRFQLDGKNINRRVKGRVRCNSGEGLCDAALKGLGLVQLPDYYVQDRINRGELVEVLTEFRAEQEGIWALYPSNRYLAPKVRRLIDYINDRLS